MKRTYFSSDFLKFFKELAANNSKDWFDAHRKRYEQSVKEPFKEFVTDLISEIHKLDPSIDIEAKDAIFRINRDIRFSKDKTPYKLDRSAIISSAGRKDPSVPGFYLSLGPDKTYLGGGAYFLTPEQLKALRNYIMGNNDKLVHVLKQRSFKEHFGEIRGEKNKRLPAEFQDMAEKQPLLYNKQFYFMAEAPADWVNQPNLMDRCLDYYKASRPLQQLLVEAVI